MRSPALLLAAALALSGASAHAASLPPGAVVLPGAQADALLHQCSRGVPARGEATWQPGARDIVALEALLPAALAPRFRGDPRAAKAPAGWGRQYVGLVRGGRRFIYGNYFPMRDGAPPLSAKDGPRIVCDGGPNFFGVEYDVAAHRITRTDFNGIA